MIRQLPVIPTIIVVAAAAVMVWLGFWQLSRADEKAVMIAAHEEALSDPEVVEVISGIGGYDYRTVQIDCAYADGWEAVAGRNANGRTGYVHRYNCPFTISVDERGEYPKPTLVVVGWSAAPVDPGFEGGVIEGIMVPGTSNKIFASKPIEGLQPLAKPDPNDLPNNHLAYAGQWFFFALTALVIYFFAVRSKLAKRD